MTCYDVGPEVIIAALIYTDRLLRLNPNFAMTHLNAKNLLHIGMTMASKFFYDKYEKNTIFFAISSNLNKKQMRAMLDLYLDMLDF